MEVYKHDGDDNFQSRLFMNAQEIQFTGRNIMLNTVHPNTKHIINQIILIGKQYIFACKCAGKKYSIIELIAKIETVYIAESMGNYKVRQRWIPYGEANKK